MQEQAAQIIAESRQAGRGLPFLGPNQIPIDFADAYDMQDRVHARLQALGLGEIVGYKVGCTTRAGQQLLGIDHPAVGALFATTIRTSGASVEHPSFHRLGIECEVAVRLGSDLPPRTTPYTLADVAPAVDTLMPSLELVDDRYPLLAEPDARVYIADDFYGAGAVLGDAEYDLAVNDLETLEGELWANDIEIGHGCAREVMGHPLHAVAWLANHLAVRGQMLRRGQVVLTGSLMPPFWVPRGVWRIEAKFPGLGMVQVQVTP